MGHSIFAVGAETVWQARRAVRKAQIEFQNLEAILDPETAVAAQSFVLPTETLERDNPNQALERAPRRLTSIRARSSTWSPAR